MARWRLAAIGALASATARAGDRRAGIEEVGWTGISRWVGIDIPTVSLEDSL